MVAARSRTAVLRVRRAWAKWRVVSDVACRTAKVAADIARQKDVGERLLAAGRSIAASRLRLGVEITSRLMSRQDRERCLWATARLAQHAFSLQVLERTGQAAASQVRAAVAAWNMRHYVCVTHYRAVGRALRAWSHKMYRARRAEHQQFWARARLNLIAWRWRLTAEAAHFSHWKRHTASQAARQATSLGHLDKLHRTAVRRHQLLACAAMARWHACTHGASPHWAAVDAARAAKAAEAAAEAAAVGTTERRIREALAGAAAEAEARRVADVAAAVADARTEAEAARQAREALQQQAASVQQQEGQARAVQEAAKEAARVATLAARREMAELAAAAKVEKAAAVQAALEAAAADAAEDKARALEVAEAKAKVALAAGTAAAVNAAREEAAADKQAAIVAALAVAKREADARLAEAVDSAVAAVRKEMATEAEAATTRTPAVIMLVVPGLSRQRQS
eukprot:g3467.t1